MNKTTKNNAESASVLVKAENLVLAHGSHLALRESSFEIPQGKVTAVIGPNGSGKSTVLQAIAGVLPVASGTLTIAGKTVAEMSKRISFVMQSVVFPTGIPITVRDVVKMGRYAEQGWFKPMTRHDRVRVEEAMETMRITDLAKRHLEELSGGQRQRVYVAQGLAQGHEILMLDEPMTGLDVGSMKIIDDVIHQETQHGHSVVLTTHDLDEAAAADHVLLLDGEIIAFGPPESVLTRRNLEKAYGAGSVHEPAQVQDSTMVDLPACEPGEPKPGRGPGDTVQSL